MRVFLNGESIEPQRAALPVLDAGLQHAVGLFETMKLRGGRVVRLEAHVDRLRRSAEALGLPGVPRVGELCDAVNAAVADEPLPEARVRLTVTPGSVSLLRGAEPGEGKPTVLVVVSEPLRYDEAYFTQGVTVSIAGALANPFDPLAGHKTLAYWGRLRTLREAAKLRCAEAIWLTTHNHLVGGAVSNLFLARGGRLLTPTARGEEAAGALPAPVLPGVTRAALLQWAADRGIEAERRTLTIDDLLDADEVFLTNSGWGVLPVVRVEKREIGDGKVGPITQAALGWCRDEA
jgi:branched-subunit amino acid aminotransferase/4-amino-4-deoxychorismate lyase